MTPYDDTACYTETAQPPAPFPLPEPPAPATKPKRVPRATPDTFHRILVRKINADKYTTVSLTSRQYQDALHFAYGMPTLVNSALRAAALAIGETKTQDFSGLVRKKALTSLRGSYRPEVARGYEAAAQALVAAKSAAAENNRAWDAVAVVGARVSGEQS
jgi:hypothetical protein